MNRMDQNETEKRRTDVKRTHSNSFERSLPILVQRINQSAKNLRRSFRLEAISSVERDNKLLLKSIARRSSSYVIPIF